MPFGRAANGIDRGLKPKPFDLTGTSPDGKNE
jgi:hypothetical protein